MNIQDAIDVIESVSGFTDESTPAGEAWLEVLSFIHCRPRAAPAVVPVPLSERLPGEGDCDAEGRCWLFSPPACGPHKIRSCWTLDSEVMEGDSHWLPAHTLPLPQARM